MGSISKILSKGNVALNLNHRALPNDSITNTITNTATSGQTFSWGASKESENLVELRMRMMVSARRMSSTVVCKGAAGVACKLACSVCRTTAVQLSLSNGQLTHRKAMSAQFGWLTSVGFLGRLFN